MSTLSSPCCAAPKGPDPQLVRRGLALAAFTIGWNLIEGFVSIGFGAAEDSVALLGFGVDSWVEVASAGVVLWRLRGETGRGPALALERERRAALWIGVLFVVLAAATVVGAAAQLWTGGHPGTTLPGLIIAGVSLSFMFALWRAKRALATALDSRTLAMDAACSRSCIQLSGVLLVGSLVAMIAPALWWADAIAALALALLIGREGIEGIRSARSAHFDGGCGCA